MPASRDLPTSLEPTSLTAGEAGDFKCLRDPPQAPCLRRPGLFPLASTPAPLSFAPVFLGLALHGRCIRRRSLGPRLGLAQCIGQALAPEAIAECVRSGGVGEAKSNIELLGLVPTPAPANWDASVTVERINL